MKYKNTIWKSASLMSVMMISFKLLGFGKQAIIASYYGANLETDVYFIAWGFVAGISEAMVKAISVSLIAIYTSLSVKKGIEEAAKLINGILELFVPFFGVIIIILIYFAPFICRLLAPSYTGDTYSSLIYYTRILSPCMLFVCFELVFGAVLDSNKSFFIPRLQSLIYSLVVILACITLADSLGIDALIIAQYGSYIVFFFVLVISVKKYHTFFSVKIEDIPELRNVLITAIPLFIGNSAIYINKLVDKAVTSSMGNGYSSALSYCVVLEQLVINIIIVNIGNILFANFSEYVAKGEVRKIKDILNTAINILICFLVAITTITIVCSKNIVMIVYLRGNFDINAVNMTAVALIGYAFSFVPVAVRDLCIKSLYAFKDTKSAMYASLISICINIFLSILLSRSMGIFGVTLATSIASIMGMFINVKSLKKFLPEYHFLNNIKVFIECLPAAILLGILASILNIYISTFVFIRFFIICVIGFILYFGVLYVLRVHEIRVFLRYFVSIIATRVKGA